MTVNKYATQAGKKYERDLTEFLRESGFDVERLRLTGAEDEGDLLLRYHDSGDEMTHRVVIEAKREKGFKLAGWIKEAQNERNNYESHRGILPGTTGFVVIHHARGKGIGQSYVTTTLNEWMKGI